MEAGARVFKAGLRFPRSLLWGAPGHQPPFPASAGSGPWWCRRPSSDRQQQVPGVERRHGVARGESWGDLGDLETSTSSLTGVPPHS